MTLCLNMIVKDERDVILRCLESVSHLIQHWVIVDTGSTDGTQDIIVNYFREKGIPGELHQRPWVDFSTNRNEALKLAKGKGDYLLFIDADEQFLYKEGFTLPPLTEDNYLVLCDNNSILYHRRLIVRSDLEWKWVGVVHETIEGTEPFTTAILPLVVNFVSGGGGARSNDPKTRLKDAEHLEKVVKNDPFNSRALFYLALSYVLLDKSELAIKMFKRRVKIGDFSEEVYLSLLQIAILKENLKKHPDPVFKAYTEAIKNRPNRMESYFYLSRFLRRQNKLKVAYEVAKKGIELPQTKDLIGVESKVYLFEMALEYSVIAFGMGKLEEGKKVALELLDKPDLPENTRQFINTLWNQLNSQRK